MSYFDSITKCPRCKIDIRTSYNHKECMNSFCESGYVLRKTYNTDHYREAIYYGNMKLVYETNTNQTYFYADVADFIIGEPPVITMNSKMLFDSGLDEIIQNYNIIN